MLLSCVPQPEMSAIRMGAEHWNMGFGEQTLWGVCCQVQRQTEGMGVRSSTSRDVCGRSSGYHRTTVTLLSYTPGAGPPWQPSTHAGPRLHGYKEQHPPQQACIPHPPQPPRLLRAPGDSVTWPITICTFSPGWGECAPGPALEQILVGGWHKRWGWSTAEPGLLQLRGEELKSLLETVNHGFTPQLLALWIQCLWNI